MARNLRQVHDLTPTRVRESTVVADFADFADVDMHAPPAFIMLSRKRNQEFLFQGVDLEVTFLWNFFVHLALYEQPHFLSVCGDCLRRSPGVTQVLRLSLSLSLSPSSKSDPGRLYVSFSLVCLEKSQGIERLCRIQARTTALLNQQQAQLTDDRRIDMHGNPQRLRLIREKFSQAKKLRKFYPFSKKRYTSGIADAFREQAKQKESKQDRAGERWAVTADHRSADRSTIDGGGP